jgi:hypothetical protein
MEGGKCELDKIMSGLRLRLIKTIARACKGSEKYEHSSKGEPRAGTWAFLKWKRFLWYSEFTWITDCSCLEQFFDMDIMPTHMLQRWRTDLLRFNFTIVHRPERMLCECDLLSRYNLWTNKWRSEQETDKEEKPTTDGRAMTTMIAGLKRYATDQAQKQHLSHSNVTTEVRGEGVRRTLLAEICDTSRAVWIIGSGANTVAAASEITGLNIRIVLKAEKDNKWRETDETKKPRQVSEATKDDEEIETDWVVIL